jgi:hypothetical protein
VTTSRDLSWSERLVLANEQTSARSPFVECPRHIATVLRLSAQLDLRALSQALHAIVMRHTTLCCVYANGVATETPPQGVPIEIHISGNNEDSVDRRIETEINRTFDLARGPLYRFAVIQGSSKSIVILTFHHIVFDGWSRRILLRELHYRYDAGSASEPLPRDHSYRDYVAWQDQQVDKHATGDEWNRRLARLAKVGDLRLASDGRVARRNGATAKQCSVTIPPSASAALRRAGRDHGTTLAVALLAVYLFLLQRHTGQSVLTVGVPMADRPRKEFETTIGLLVNMLVVEADLRPCSRVADLLASSRRAFARAYEHRHIPYGYLLHSLSRSGNGGHPPFRTVFNVANVPKPAVSLGRLVAEPMHVVPDTNSFADFSMHVHGASDDLTCTTIYDATRFSDARMRAITQEFVHLVVSAARSPAARLSELASMAPST